MRMIIAAYFFSDETECLWGPYLSSSDAERACVFYTKENLEGMSLTPEEQDELKEINIRRQNLIESIGNISYETQNSRTS